MKPRFFYDNRFADDVVSASTTASGNYYAGNIADFRPYTYWKPTALPATLDVDCGSARSADSAFIYGHDLFTQGATIEIRSSTDAFAASNVLQASSTPTSNNPFVLLFASASYRYWRIRITGTTMPYLAIGCVGVRLEPDGIMQANFDPLYRDLDGITNVSDNGQPLGKSINFAAWSHPITFNRVSWSWLRTTFIPAYNSWLRAYPFGWQWHAGVDSVPLLCTMGDELRTPHYPNYTADVSFDLRGLI